MASKESLLRRMAAKLQKLDERMGELRTGLEGSREQVRARYNEELAKLKAEREALEKQMNALKEAGAEALKELRSGLLKGYKELHKALDGAWKHFRRDKKSEPPSPEGGSGA